MFAGCRCPRCSESVLVVREVEDRKALTCSVCGGAFLGTKTGLRLLAVLEAEVGSAGARGCPVCRRAMRTVAAAGVDVDVCKAHGVWCDAGELPALVGAVANAIGKPVARPVQAAASSVAAEGLGTDLTPHHSASEPSDVEVAKEWVGAGVDAVLSPITDLPYVALSLLDDLLF